MDLATNIATAKEALEQKKAEYWIQYGVVLALEKLYTEELNATRTGREISGIESESGSDSQ